MKELETGQPNIMKGRELDGEKCVVLYVEAYIRRAYKSLNGQVEFEEKAIIESKLRERVE